MYQAHTEQLERKFFWSKQLQQPLVPWGLIACVKVGTRKKEDMNISHGKNVVNMHRG